MTREAAKAIIKAIYEEQLKDEFLLSVQDEVMTKIDDAFKVVFELLDNEPCEDAVSRQAVLDMAEDMTGQFGNKHRVVTEGLISMLPPVTPTRKKGQWIKEYDNSALDGLYHCSVCGRKLWRHKEESILDYPYCHCGAEMEGEE